MKNLKLVSRKKYLSLNELVELFKEDNISRENIIHLIDSEDISAYYRLGDDKYLKIVSIREINLDEKVIVKESRARVVDDTIVQISDQIFELENFLKSFDSDSPEVKRYVYRLESLEEELSECYSNSKEFIGKSDLVYKGKIILHEDFDNINLENVLFMLSDIKKFIPEICDLKSEYETARAIKLMEKEINKIDKEYIYINELLRGGDIELNNFIKNIIKKKKIKVYFGHNDFFSSDTYSCGYIKDSSEEKKVILNIKRAVAEREDFFDSEDILFNKINLQRDLYNIGLTEESSKLGACKHELASSVKFIFEMYQNFSSYCNNGRKDSKQNCEVMYMQWYENLDISRFKLLHEEKMRKKNNYSESVIADYIKKVIIDCYEGNNLYELDKLSKIVLEFEEHLESCIGVSGNITKKKIIEALKSKFKVIKKRDSQVIAALIFQEYSQT